MLLASRCLPALVLAISGAVVLGAPAAADPVYTGDSAESVVDDLQAQGYSVQINWLNGYDTVPLSYCTVQNINNPATSVPVRAGWRPSTSTSPARTTRTTEAAGLTSKTVSVT
jgi:hypothetical protein